MLQSSDGDRWDEIGCAWIGKELLRDVYQADGHAGPQVPLGGFYEGVNQVDVAELSRLARTVRQWQPEILAYHDQRYSNAKTEKPQNRQPHRREAKDEPPTATAASKSIGSGYAATTE